MLFNSDPLEQTTAATDLILATGAFWCAVLVWQWREAEPEKRWLWIALFSSLTSASFFGALVHGLLLIESQQRFLWAPINLSICLVIAFFIAIAEKDKHSSELRPQFIRSLLYAAVIVGLTANLLARPLYLLLPLEAVALIYVIGVYMRLRSRDARTISGKRWMLGGLLLTALAGATQSLPSLEFTLLWTFDRRGIFHLIQLIALPFFLKAACCLSINRAP